MMNIQYISNELCNTIASPTIFKHISISTWMKGGISTVHVHSPDLFWRVTPFSHHSLLRPENNMEILSRKTASQFSVWNININIFSNDIEKNFSCDVHKAILLISIPTRNMNIMP